MANETAKTVKDDRVDVFVPRAGANEDPNLYVCINGKEFLLPRGQTSRVPVYVKEAIECYHHTETFKERRQQELIEKTLKPTNQ